MFGGVEESLAEPPKIAVINQDGGSMSLVAMSVFNATSEIVYNGTDIQEALNVLDDTGGVSLFVIPSNFTSDIENDTKGTIEIYWIMKGAGIMDSVPGAAADANLVYVDQAISTALISGNMSENASLILNPTQYYETTLFKGKEMTGISPIASPV